MEGRASRLDAFRRRGAPELAVARADVLRELLDKHGLRPEHLPFLLESDPQAAGHRPGAVLAASEHELYLVVSAEAPSAKRRRPTRPRGKRKGGERHDGREERHDGREETTGATASRERRLVLCHGAAVEPRPS